MASEDFGSFGAEWHVPSVFWFVGGVDRDVYLQQSKFSLMGNLTAHEQS